MPLVWLKAENQSLDLNEDRYEKEKEKEKERERQHIYAIHVRLKRIRIKPIHCNVRERIHATIIINCLLNVHDTGIRH